MLCLRIFTLPAPSGFFQSISPFERSTAQRARLSPSAMFRKMRSRQTIGVEPLRPGIATFQTTFSSVVHLTGRFFSVLTPLSAGPRHCGQFSALVITNESRTKLTTPREYFRIYAILQKQFVGAALRGRPSFPFCPLRAATEGRPYKHLTQVKRCDRFTVAQVQFRSDKCRGGPGKVLQNTHLRNHF